LLGALGGDALALLGAATGAGYYVIGRRVRQTVGVWRYATGVYAVAAVVLGLLELPRRSGIMLFSRSPLSPTSVRNTCPDRSVA